MAVFAHFLWDVSYTEGDNPLPIIQWRHSYDKMRIEVGITLVVSALLRIKTSLH